MKYLKIYGYEAGANGPSDSEFDTFTAQVNPASIQMSHSISYGGGGAGADGNDTKTGKAVPQQKYTGTNAQNLSFTLIVDGTGVLPDNTEAESSVKDQIEKFKTVCYYYRGDIHEPPYIKVFWNGESLFKYNQNAYHGRLSSFDIKYTLFSADGDPLRAEISAKFVGSLDPVSESNLRGDNSPDLTHVIIVKAGDTLPVLCEKIYGKRQMYHEVAKVNNLLSFRDIKPGTELVFPPIK